MRRCSAEVAKGALRVLARAATGLPTQQVVRLLLEMARAGMGQELNALAAVLSAPGVRKAPEVVALAAAVAPDEALCQQTLQQAGLVALAACFTYNWCDSQRRRVGVPLRLSGTTCLGFRSQGTGQDWDLKVAEGYGYTLLAYVSYNDVALSIVPIHRPSNRRLTQGLRLAGGLAMLCKPSRSGSSSWPGLRMRKMPAASLCARRPAASSRAAMATEVFPLRELP